MALAQDAGQVVELLRIQSFAVVVKNPSKILRVLRIPRQRVSAFLWMDVASRAEVLLTACNQTLLRVITDVADQEEIAVPDILVSADHPRSLATSFVQRTQEKRACIDGIGGRSRTSACSSRRSSALSLAGIQAMIACASKDSGDPPSVCCQR